MLTDNLPHDLLQKYVTLRQNIDSHADAIRNLANLVAILEQSNAEYVHIDSLALAYVHRLIVTHCLDILEALDAFINVDDAKTQLVKSATER